MKTLTITPQMFVSEPFKTCPKCHMKSQYGVLIINSNSYTRRCNNCMYSESFKLPELKKKIIYLDQMVISKMMNSIRPESKSKESLIEWKKLFEKLDRLVKLQLIICPYSPVHKEESLVTSVFDDLKAMYSHLSNGTSFYSSDEIIRFQLTDAFMKWLDDSQTNIDVEDITHGDLNGWQDRIRVTVDLKLDKNKDYVTEVENHRNLLSWGLQNIFKNWKNHPEKNFDFWYEHERNSFGMAYWDSYLQLVLEDGETGLLGFIRHQQSVTITYFSHLLRNSGIIDEKDILLKLKEFFGSEYVKDIPYVKLFSMLDATMAIQTSKGGRTQLPNQGTHNDLTIISCYSPYCDALFIDNSFRETIKQSEKYLHLGIYGKFYSQNCFNEFLTYLDKIESEAPAEHLKLINEVYGEAWLNPYTTMYIQRNR